MKNEIVRKLTSLTLMTIMFAGGLSFAIPGVMPEASAAHNANLFVSAENTFSSNTFNGPMVIEVVVTDSDISALDDVLGEPIVSVNGDRLRMLQANDGSWYGYFADRLQAQRADATQPGLNENGVITNQDASTAPGLGLNFGKFCTATSGTAVLGFSMADTEGFAIPANATASGVAGNAGGTNNGTDGTNTIGACDGGFTSAFRYGAAFKQMNVIRENRTLNFGPGDVTVGQLGIRDSNYWPFIHLFDFTPTGSAIIKYQKGGSVQTTTLTFDSQSNSGISLSFDRTSYPAAAQVHATLQDFALNIDPTDEDSWTWGTNVRDTTTNKTVFYQLFNQTGGRDADARSFTFAETNQFPILVLTGGALGAQNLFGNLTNFMFEDNGVLTLNNNTQGTDVDIIELKDNSDSEVFQETG
ncbi:hypothetical protein HYZ41_00215, partial [archaeon]|nr:hypothetical protein [archaeon]